MRLAEIPIIILILLGSCFVILTACEKDEINECECEITQIIGSYPSLLSTNCGFIDTDKNYKIGDCYE